MPSQPKPKKPGRPKLAEGHAKAVMLRVRVSPAELKAVDAAAKAKSMTVSDFIRETINAAV